MCERRGSAIGARRGAARNPEGIEDPEIGVRADLFVQPAAETAPATRGMPLAAPPPRPILS